MEKVLKQKFWILLGIGLVMTITGWWMATGTLASTIAQRKTDLDKAFSRIPGGEIPNTDWATQLAARNTEQDQAVKYTASLLWERQKSRMTWPDTVTEFAWNNGYRGEIALSGRENYRLAYGVDVRRVWLTVRPFNPIDGSGIVAYGVDHRALPQRIFGQLAPSSAEMWDAQEDLWLLESLLQSIVRVNGGPEGQRGDAYIHVIEKLELCGGVPAGQRKASGGSATGTGPGGPSGAHGGAGALATFGGDMGGTSMRPGAGSLSVILPADFDKRDEFGEDGSSTARAVGSGPMSSAAAMPTGAHGGGGSGPGTPSATSIRRYIDDDAAYPYKTRGFYMTVLMDHRKIPSLVAELSASEASAWPVEVVRIQMVRLHEDDVGNGPAISRPPTGLSGLNILGGQSGYSSAAMPTSRGSGDDASDLNFNSGFTPTFGPTPGSDTAGADPANPGVLQAAAAGAAGLQGALEDPFMARVALCGIITIYKEVKMEPVAAAPAPAPAAPANPAATSGDAAATPAEPVPATPASEAPAEPATPATEDKAPAKPEETTPTPATPATPQDPSPPGS